MPAPVAGERHADDRSGQGLLGDPQGPRVRRQDRTGRGGAGLQPDRRGHAGDPRGLPRGHGRRGVQSLHRQPQRGRAGRARGARLGGPRKLLGRGVARGGRRGAARAQRPDRRVSSRHAVVERLFGGGSRSLRSLLRRVRVMERVPATASVPIPRPFRFAAHRFPSPLAGSAPPNRALSAFRLTRG